MPTSAKGPGRKIHSRLNSFVIAIVVDSFIDDDSERKKRRESKQIQKVAVENNNVKKKSDALPVCSGGFYLVTSLFLQSFSIYLFMFAHSSLYEFPLFFFPPLKKKKKVEKHDESSTLLTLCV